MLTNHYPHTKTMLTNTSQVPYVSITPPLTSLFTDLPAPLGHISQPNSTTESSSRPTSTRPITPSSRPNLESKPRSPINMDVPRLRATSPFQTHPRPIRVPEPPLNNC